MESTRTILSLCLILLILSSCEKDEEKMLPPPYMESFADVEECLSFSSMKSTQPPENQSCISYNYDGDSILSITHLNSGFNCCPETILTSFELRNDTIFIIEDDSLDLCRCNCLFNVEFTIHNLSPGKYVLEIEEALVGTEQTGFVINLDLEKNPSDNVCLIREFYPWH